MYLGTALFLVAVGAILRWAVTVQAEGFNIQLAGLIILIVGLVGAAIALYFLLAYRPPPSPPGPRDGGLPPHEHPSDYPPPRV